MPRLSTTTKDLFDRKLSVIWSERDEQLQRDIGKRMAECAAGGGPGLLSGAAQASVVRLVSGELKVRAEIAVGEMAVFSDHFDNERGEDLLDEAEALVLNAIQKQSSHLPPFILDAPCFKRGVSGGLIGILDPSLSVVTDRACELARINLALLFAQMTKAAGQVGANTTVNISGSSNIVNAGIHQSSLSVIVNQETSAGLEEALRGLTSLIQQHGAPQGVDESELRELIKDCLAEVSRETPNKVKLVTLLRGIAVTIQTSAVLRPAYEILMEALRALGLR